MFCGHDGSEIDTIPAEEIGIKVARVSWFISAILSSWLYNTDKSGGMKDGDGNDGGDERGTMEDESETGGNASDDPDDADGDGDDGADMVDVLLPNGIGDNMC